MSDSRTHQPVIGRALRRATLSVFAVAALALTALTVSRAAVAGIWIGNGGNAESLNFKIEAYRIARVLVENFPDLIAKRRPLGVLGAPASLEIPRLIERSTVHTVSQTPVGCELGFGKHDGPVSICVPHADALDPEVADSPNIVIWESRWRKLNLYQRHEAAIRTYLTIARIPQPTVDQLDPVIHLVNFGLNLDVNPDELPTLKTTDEMIRQTEHQFREILSWLWSSTTIPSLLPLPQADRLVPAISRGLSLNRYAARPSDALAINALRRESPVEIELLVRDAKLRVLGDLEEKAAVNYRLPTVVATRRARDQHRTVIEINVSQWSKLDPLTKVFLVVHELMGAAGIEDGRYQTVSVLYDQLTPSFNQLTNIWMQTWLGNSR